MSRVYSGELYVRREWSCRDCGATEYGDLMRLELSRATQATIDRKADALFRSTRTDFPVGWSNYLDGAVCPRCPHP